MMVCLAAFLNILVLTRGEAKLSNSWTVKRIMMIVFDEKTLCPDPGWSGENCDEPVCTEECVHGYCIEPDICSCDSWYVGDLCQHEWKHADCINGVGPTCECIEGWKGESCTEPICKDGCHPIFGSCENPGECTCTHDSMGSDLCTECTPVPECLHGTCEGPGDCICNPGWTGYYCDTPICSPGCHVDRGYCRFPNECICEIGYQGKLCDECVTYPDCLNGYCNYPWQCICKEGWTGSFCDILRNSTPDEKSLNAEGIHGNDLVKGIYSALESSQIYDLFSNYNWDGLNTDEPKSDEYYEAYGLYSDNENSFEEFNPDNYNPDVYSIYEYNPMIEDVYEDYEPAATIKPNYAGIKQSPVEERMIVNRGRRGGKGKRNGRQGRSGKGKGRGKRRSPRTGIIRPRGRILASPYRRGSDYDNSDVDSLEEYFEDSPEVLGVQTGNTIVELSPDKPISRSMSKEGSRSLSNDQYWSEEEFEETEINSETKNDENDLDLEGSADLISNEHLTANDLAEVYDNEEEEEDSSFHDDYVVTDNDFNDLDTNRFPGKVGKAKSKMGKIGKVNRGKGKGKLGGRKAAKRGRAKAKAKLRVLGKAKFGFGKM